MIADARGRLEYAACLGLTCICDSWRPSSAARMRMPRQEHRQHGRASTHRDRHILPRLFDEIEEPCEQSETRQRLATIPGVGMLSATIVAATTPDVDNFDCARDYAAWLGLTPKPTPPEASRGRPDLEDGIRRLLYLSAMAQILLRRRLRREPGSDWLSSMLIRKKTKVVAIYLAHRMARTIFALLMEGSR